MTAGESVIVGFMRIKNTGFNSAMVSPYDYPTWWGVTFLRGDRVAVADSDSGPDSLFYDGPIQDDVWPGFRGVPDAYRSACEGALMLPWDQDYRQMLLFKGDMACWYHRGTGVISEGPVTELAYDGGPTWNTLLPPGYRDHVDALLMDDVGATADWKTYVFKGDRVATIDWATGCTRDCTIIEGAQPTPGWAKLAPEWTSDFDHVLPLSTISGNKRSLLIKGVNGCVFNWETGPEKTGELTSLLPALTPLPALYTTQYRPVSGRWIVDASAQGYMITFRIDVDGPTATYRISGDLYSVDGGTRTYSRSFDGEADVTASATELVATCKPSWSIPYSVVGFKVFIPRTATTHAEAPTARVETTFDSGYVLSEELIFESSYFRTVDLETDAMAGKPAFVSYDTSKAPVPAGYSNRTLTITSAFAEAGIQIRTSDTANQVNVDSEGSGEDLKWSSSELHAAMVKHFSGYKDEPQWKLWAFTAGLYVDPAFLGVAFDNLGKQRQGMAVFYDAQLAYYKGEMDYRGELHTNVHELGHCFNLAHSFDKANVGAKVGLNNGYGDLSWMNYPDLYRFDENVKGIPEFWKRFRFSFTTNELIHLRHAFYNNIVPGGVNFRTFGSTGHRPDDPVLAAMAEPLTDESGLTLTLSARPFVYGEPVTVEVKLARAGRDVRIHPNLSPTGENLRVAITGPSGNTRLFQPLARGCTGHGDTSLITLTADQPAIYASAYLGSGADGQYFTDPGRYRVWALYTAADGSRVVSDTLPVRIRLPHTQDDQDAGELLMGDQAGTLMSLLGSDSPSLNAGNDALTELSSRFADHPLAVYSRLAQGANAGRHFQHLTEGRIHVRPPDTKEAATQLTAAIDASTGPQGLNNITLNAAMRRLATVHAKAGDLEQADKVLAHMVAHFRAQNVPPHVLSSIQAQADATRAQIMPNHSRPRRNGGKSTGRT